jgi:hypothetical protein
MTLLAAQTRQEKLWRIFKVFSAARRKPNYRPESPMIAAGRPGNGGKRKKISHK